VEARARDDGGSILPSRMERQKGIVECDKTHSQRRQHEDTDRARD
jgi:hypothetical protein